MKKLVSIIIPALNEERYIGGCLEAVSRIICPRDVRYEVIVVDNGSADRTVEIAKAFHARVLVKKGVRISALRNHGAREAKGEILAFVDADCLVEPDWLKCALESLERNGTEVTGCVYRIPEDSTWIGKVCDMLSQKRSSGAVNYLPGGNIVIMKNVFFAVNGFDEGIQTNEDYDLCFRLREKGYVIYSDPSIASVHLGTPNTVKRLFKRELWHGTNTFKVFIRDVWKFKNFKVISFSVFILLSALNLVLSAAYAAAGGGAVYLMISVLIPVAGIGALSLKTALRHSKVGMLHYIFLYYSIYGAARGISLFKSISEASRR